MCDFIHRGIVLERASTELPGSAIDLEDPVLV